MKAYVTNVQRFSIHDGSGIRTTVFMKGCNLRCLWCHNPETQVFTPQLMFYKHRCVGCGACRKVCNKMFTAECIQCGECAKVCRHGALEMSGKSVTLDELFAEIIKDKDYYIVSGGGVTFSGGEPLMQYEFLKEMLKRCKEAQLHTTIETAGNVPWNKLEGLLPYLDFILYDIKAVDEEKHRKFTGVSNRQILDNAVRLMENVPDRVLFRMPLVPGYNDSEFERVVEFVNGHQLEIMPYHSIGVGKYHAMQWEYELEEVKPPTLEAIRELTHKYDNVFCEENLA